MKNLQSGLCWFATFLVLVVPQVFAQDVMPLKGAGVPTMIAVYITAGGILRWGAGFASLDYVATSPDEGVTQVSNNTSDFAVTDFPMLLRNLEQKKLLQFPIMAAAIVPVVNLPGIKSDQLQLTGAILAEIMSGKIEN